MTWYYNVIPEKKVPTTILIYSSQKTLSVGQLVVIELRSQRVLGMVAGVVQEQDISYAKKEIKEIVQAEPYIISQASLRFISLFWNNTLNDYNAIINVITGWYASLSKKQHAQLLQQHTLHINTISTSINKKTLQNINSDFSVYKDQWFRIRDIIRRLLSQQRSHQNHPPQLMVIFFPEAEIIKKYITYISSLKEDAIMTHIFTGEKSAASRATFLSTISHFVSKDQEQSLGTPILHIILTTRIGILLPFVSLDSIVVTYESSTHYIQEQNGIYFDTRDAAYLLSRAHNASIEFLSDMPSLRGIKINSERSLQSLMNNYPHDHTKQPKLKIYKRNKKDTFFGILSEQILLDIGVEYTED